MKINWTRLNWLLLAFVIALAILMAISPKAKANMCGPVPGLPSYSNGWVKSCEPWIPMTGNLPRIPILTGPRNAPLPLPGVGGLGGWQRGGRGWGY